MFWLQLAPAVVGVAFLTVHWRRYRDTWHWAEQMPLLVTLSVLTTPYGWTFDQVLLVVPIVALAARYTKKFGGFPQKVVLVYTAVNVALIFALMLKSPFAFPIGPLVVAVFLLKGATVMPEGIREPSQAAL